MPEPDADAGVRAASSGRSSRRRRGRRRPRRRGRRGSDIAVATTRAPIEPFAGGAGMSTDVLPPPPPPPPPPPELEPPPPPPPPPGSSRNRSRRCRGRPPRRPRSRALGGAEPRLGLTRQLRLERLLLLLQGADLVLESGLEALRLAEAALDRGLVGRLLAFSCSARPRPSAGLLAPVEVVARGAQRDDHAVQLLSSSLQHVDRSSMSSSERAESMRRHRIGITGAVGDDELRGEVALAVLDVRLRGGDLVLVVVDVRLDALELLRWPGCRPRSPARSARSSTRSSPAPPLPPRACRGSRPSARRATPSRRCRGRPLATKVTARWRRRRCKKSDLPVGVGAVQACWRADARLRSPPIEAGQGLGQSASKADGFGRRAAGAATRRPTLSA